MCQPKKPLLGPPPQQQLAFFERTCVRPALFTLSYIVDTYVPPTHRKSGRLGAQGLCATAGGSIKSTFSIGKVVIKKTQTQTLNRTDRSHQ